MKYCRLMSNNGLRKRIKRISFVVLGVLCPLLSVAQSGEETTDLLVKMGFENVSWAEDEQERVYVIENSAYRLTGVGIGKAIDEIQKYGLPEGGKLCRIIVLDNNVPQVSLCCNAPDGEGKELSRKDWNVSYDLGKSWEMVKGRKRKNSSLFKVDVLVYPDFSFQNGRLSVPYQVNLNINPTLQASLWKGGKLTAQLVVPVVNDFGEYVNKEIRPGFVTLSQTVRLPYNIFLTGTVGFFNNDRAGVDLSGKMYLNNGNWWVDGRVSYTVEGLWGEWVIEKGEWKRKNRFLFAYERSRAQVTGQLGINYYWKRFDTQLAFRGESFIEGDYGVRFDMIRHFKYCSIGFYGMYVHDYWWNKGLNGGFQFQINLPPYKYKRKGYIPRVMPSRNWGFRYNAAGTYIYGERFRADADDNISNDIKYNPNYIHKELMNF